MPDTETFECAGCGGTFPSDRAGMGMNMGSEPEFWCDCCKPPATANEIVQTIQAFTGLKGPGKK